MHIPCARCASTQVKKKLEELKEKKQKKEEEDYLPDGVDRCVVHAQRMEHMDVPHGVSFIQVYC
jgi:hypothetical protein